MGTNFIKVIPVVSVYRKCLFIPKSRDELYLNNVRLIEVFIFHEDRAESQINEVSSALKKLST